jgi:acyl-CoA reductase-like NAD-dependent aldehyde dehydrogenase/nicotinamidase-related amidase
VKPAVVLIDLQRDFLDAPSLRPGRASVIAGAAALLRSARARAVPVIHVRTSVSEHRPPMPHRAGDSASRCRQGSPGHEFPPELAPLPGEAAIDKTFFSAFEGGELLRLLRETGADTLVLAGVHLHACVRQTAIDAYAAGFRVLIAEDAVGTDDPLHGAITRRYLAERFVEFVPASAFEGAQPPGQRVHLDLGHVPDAVRRWRRVSVGERLRMLRLLATIIERRREELAMAITAAVRKPIRYSRGEITRTLELIDVSSRMPESPSSGRGRKVELGAVAVITPWNNPLAIPFGKIVPAILHGNVALWKPSPRAEGVNGLLEDILDEAGFLQASACTLVPGNADVALALMNATEVDAVTLTGGEAAGFAAIDACSRRNIPLQAELGGNNAAIVWRDADLEYAATAVAEGAFAFAGQRCTANRRVIVDDACYGKYLELLRSASQRLPSGDPREDTTILGPMVGTDARDRLDAVVARARARLQVFSGPDSDQPDFHPATLVECDDPAEEVVQEETFGPLLVVQRAHSFHEAMSLLNGVRQGLAAAVFSRSEELHRQFLGEAKAGILKINMTTSDADAISPFGGWKSSGMGPPEHGAGNQEFYTRWQSVYRAK